MGLSETIKWSHPCYTHNGRNIAILGAFRGDFRITYINAELLTDAENILERAGDQSQVANVMRFQNVDAVEKAIPHIQGFLSQLIEKAASGVKPTRTTPKVEFPDELRDALAADAELKAAFDKLTPGRQRSYVLFLNGAKTSQTRVARIIKSRDKIFAGKGALEK